MNRWRCTYLSSDKVETLVVANFKGETAWDVIPAMEKEQPKDWFIQKIELVRE